MPSIEDSSLYLDTMSDVLTAQEWRTTGSPIAARTLQVHSFIRAVAELGSVDEAETLVEAVESDVRFDQHIIENL